jgi:hypothetical protein
MLFQLFSSCFSNGLWRKNHHQITYRMNHFL